MVRCEVCGREIRGTHYRRIIEGARLVVCEQCSRFSSEEWSPKPAAPPPSSRSRSRAINEVESAENLVPVEGYGSLIREAREKLRLEHKEVARLIGEKISTVKMLEKGELIPTQAMAQKIRRVLKVDVLARETIRTAFVLAPQKEAPTIGDLVKLKEKKDREST